MCYFLVTTSLKSFSHHRSRIALEEFPTRIRESSEVPPSRPRSPSSFSHDVHRRRPVPDESLDFTICYHSYRTFIATETMFSIAMKRNW